MAGGTINFVLRTDKVNSRGLAPIELIYSVKGVRKYYGIGESVFKINWDSKSKQAVFKKDAAVKKQFPDALVKDIPTGSKIDSINKKMRELVHDIEEIENKFRVLKVVYDSQNVINKLKEVKSPETKKGEKTNLVYDYIDKYINDNKDIREPGSLTVYKTLKTHLLDFQTAHNEKIEFSKIDADFFRRFQNFLSKPRQRTINKKNRVIKKVIALNNVTIAKQLSTLKTFLNYAKSENIEIKEFKYKIEKPKLEVVALTNDEFLTLFNYDLSNNKRLAQARDIFCFACTTGLRYSDLRQLQWHHIKDDCIEIVVRKTKSKIQKPLTIPLNPYSAQILSRYKDHHLPLPMISNFKLNVYIKELGELAGINSNTEIVRVISNKEVRTAPEKFKKLSIHVGRKTFCTLSLERGMSAEEVMAISGHEDYRSFKRYVDVTNKRKKESMRNAWGAIGVDLKKSNLKAV